MKHATGATIDGRYRIEQKLGQGAAGIVYRVHDLQRKQRLALKVLRTDFDHGDGTQRFEREFHAIGQLRHPNIIAVHDLAPTYFTMEYVEGRSIDPAERRDIHAILRIALEVARALRYIHSQGMIHGDLKPAHVLLDNRGKVKLIDFGLSGPGDGAGGGGDPRAAGTLEYLAPERARGQAGDARSDLYSLGAFLYELCTGRPPFEDADPMALIMKQVEARPRPPRELRPQVPKDLEKLILALLEKDPSKRPSSADQAITVLTALSGRKEIREARIEKGARFLFEPDFVGRDDDLERLDELFRRAKDGRGGGVLVRGEAGMGRSRLLAEFRARHLFGQTVLLSATCEPDPDRAYAPFASLVEQACFALEREGKQVLLKQVASRWGAGLLRLSPDLAHKPYFQGVKPRMFADLRRIAADLLGLVGVIAQVRPVIVSLDDLHGADRLSIQLVEQVARGIDRMRVLLVVSGCPERESPQPAFSQSVTRLSGERNWTDMTLRPLSAREVEHLAASMMGLVSLDPMLAKQVAALSQGNALVVQEVMKSLAEQEVIYKRGGTWQVDPKGTDRLRPSEGLEDWLLRKVEQLGKRHREVLAAAALIGSRISFDLLRVATRLDDSVLYYVLADLVRERLLIETAEKDRRVYRLAADRIREAVVEWISPRERNRIHRAVAGRIEETAGPRIEAFYEEIGEHFAACGEHSEALAYFRRAADRARERYAVRRAIHGCERAYASARALRDDEARAELLAELAGLHEQEGDVAGARQRWERCAEAAESIGRHDLRARAHDRLGRIALRNRFTDEAAEHFRRARKHAEAASDSEGTVRFEIRMGQVHAVRHELDRALERFERGVQGAREIESTALLGQAVLRLGEVQLRLHRYPAAAAMLEEAARLAARPGGEEERFRVLLAQAELTLRTGQIEEATAVCTRIREELTGVSAELAGAGWLRLAFLEFRREQFGSAQRLLDRAMQVFEDLDDPLAQAEAHALQGEFLVSVIGDLTGRRRSDALRALKTAGELFIRAGAQSASERTEAVLTRVRKQFEEGDLGALKTERDNLMFLQRLGHAVNSELDLERLLNMIMDMVIETVRAERGFLILTGAGGGEGGGDGDGDGLKVAVARNIDRETIEKADFKISHTISRMVIENRRPILTRDAQTDGRFKKKISVLNLKLRSILCVPLVAKQKILGAVYVDNRFVSEQFNETNLRLLTAFADRAATAIENARLYGEVTERRRELEAANRSIGELNRKLQEQVAAQHEEIHQVKESLAVQRRELAVRYSYHNLMGKSAVMQEVFRRLERLEGTHVPVLIEGESGTGKELVARAIHVHSDRREANFVSENCAAIAPTLLESELFGAVKGAYTGADRDRKGLFVAADGGTLFLDEIAEMDPEMQSKLLRVLEGGEVRPVGGEVSRIVDVRLLAATNRNIEGRIREGAFREDLFYRLNVVRILLPPLRDRKEDIPLLVEHFLAEMAGRGGARRTIDEEGMRLLLAYDWPGNVRELRHFLERAVLFARGTAIGPEEIRAQIPRASGGGEGDDSPMDTSYKDARKRMLDDFNRRYVKEALIRCGGNVSQAAKEMGIERQYLHKLMRQADIDAKDFR